MIGCPPGLLCEVDMEALEHFGVVIVCGAVESNRFHVMDEGMKLRNIEVVSNPELDQDVLVLVVGLQSFRQVFEGRVVMGGVLRKVNEVEK